ncbi:C-C motif chemokine 4-like [Alligator sinensis]|uniref:C-C motif chemokine 4-like n=1 Tax=Alligator sinensis TaxID=38654 RepID=A0A3Q0GRH9_ALLSI|nr:C-C motif chemokine 4-like [Alligator sinensis]
MAKATGLVFILLLMATFCLQRLAQRGPAVPDKCCFNFQTTKIKKANIVTYYPTSPECPHRAVIIQTKRGQEICVKANAPWVKKCLKWLKIKSLSIPS